MQKLEVLIEENASGSVRPVEVIADAPVGALVPALVEELRLPEMDSSGKKLVYMLRDASGGRVLPANTTLLASGVGPGARLALDAYAPLSGGGAMPVRSGRLQPDPALHSAVTIADAAGFAPLAPFNAEYTSGALPLTEKKNRRWSRRAFFLLGGAVLGVGGAGLGYAAYHAYTTGTLHGNTVKQTTVPAQPVTTTQKKPAQAPKKTPFPTTAQAVFTFNKHQQTVRAVGWSFDGTMLASGSDDTHVLIWSPTGQVLHDLPHPGAVMTLAWSTDAQRLVTGALNQVAFYTVQNATRVALHHHAQAVTSVTWDAHNQMQAASASQDTRVIIWNTNNYQAQTRFMRHTTPVSGISWSADGQSIASATQGGVIRVWNSGNTQELHGGYAIKAPVSALAFAPTGMQLAAGGSDGAVRIWNGLTCQQQANATIANQCVDTPLTLQVAPAPVHTLSWSPDARFLAVGTGDGKITVWYLAHDQQKPIVTAQQNETVRSLTWSPKGDQLAAASGNTVTLFKLV
ncbi:MAG TPA: EsaB/YukD family protein [Ktedonobacteraceae bacterium]|nr:EsaB/YukD family protein [Ktedonobacteraceae bacterium]